MLQTEQTLREKAEAENLKDVEMLEALCKEFDGQLQKESKLREEAEIGKMEAVKIVETLLQRVEELSAESQTFIKLSEAKQELEDLNRQLNTEKHLRMQDQLHQEILDLQQMLQTEQTLREKAEAENLKDVEMLEALCKEFDGQLQKESKLREEAEIGKMEAVEIAETLLQRVEELSAESQTFIKLSEAKQELEDLNRQLNMKNT
ncbi:hypothetical protein D5F01_LYC10355 [Larimichthys crocea]|uniref:Uncharacterized protein n=1 Tax=Larimichthys crocea TaxID=215358 RepID=A0A6G0IGY1_LARCR|nr:hypothetical protein D5F01_LYC10355 [Larimichthys crocea]